MTVRVIEYFADIEGEEVPEMFCLVTGLLDWQEYPARELAGLYKWRWDGSDCATRRCRYCWGWKTGHLPAVPAGGGKLGAPEPGGVLWGGGSAASHARRRCSRRCRA